MGKCRPAGGRWIRASARPPPARVRHALVGAGAVVGVAGEIGYGPSPAAPAHVVDSGLTLVPGVAESALAAAGR